MCIAKFNNSIGNSCVTVIAQGKTEETVSARGTHLAVELLNLIYINLKKAVKKTQ